MMNVFELIYVASSIILIWMVQSSFFPIPITLVPRMRTWFRIPDAFMKFIGARVSFSLFILGLQMFGGVFGTQLGIHYALVHYLYVTYFLGLDDFSPTIVWWCYRINMIR